MKLERESKVKLADETLAQLVICGASWSELSRWAGHIWVGLFFGQA